MSNEGQVCAYSKGERVELPEVAIFFRTIPSDPPLGDFTPEPRSR